MRLFFVFLLLFSLALMPLCSLSADEAFESGKSQSVAGESATSSGGSVPSAAKKGSVDVTGSVTSGAGSDVAGAKDGTGVTGDRDSDGRDSEADGESGAAPDSLLPGIFGGTGDSSAADSDSNPVRVGDIKEELTVEPPELKSEIQAAKRAERQKAESSANRLSETEPVSPAASDLSAKKPAGSADSPSSLENGYGGYDVEFFNRRITTLRRDTVHFTAEARAKIASVRIRKVINSGEVGPIRPVKIKYGYEIRVGKKALFRILEGDSPPLSGQTLDQYAATAANSLREARRSYDEQRNWKSIVVSVLLLILAVVVTWLLLKLIAWLKKLLDRHVEGWIRGFLKKFSSSDFAKKYSKVFALYINRTVLVLMYLALAMFVYTELTFVLSLFPYTRPWATGLLQNISAILVGFYNGFIKMLPSLIIFVMILFSTKIIVSLTGIFFDGVKNGDIYFPWIDKDTIVPTRRITHLFLWMVGLGLAYPFIPGSESDAFKGISVILGLMVSIGSSNIINQAISGLIIIYTKTLKIGDFVKVKEHEGYVTATGVFNLKIRTTQNEEVVIPNSVILDSAAINFSKFKDKKGVALKTVVGLDYDVPWRQVNAMLLEAAKRTTSLKKESGAYVWQTDMADYYMEYTLVTWIDRPGYDKKIKSELYANIQDVFNEYGVQIMTPRYLTIYKNKIWSPKEDWYREPASREEEPRKTFGLYDSLDAYEGSDDDSRAVDEPADEDEDSVDSGGAVGGDRRKEEN